jgi:hypothetical protein
MQYHIELLTQISNAKEKCTGYLFFSNLESILTKNGVTTEQIEKTIEYIKKYLISAF